jgi:hypothetical protein
VAWSGPLLLGCATATPAPTTPPEEPASPVPKPHPGIVGCVEPRELKAYVLALEADRKTRREAALKRLGGEWTRRTGEYLPPESRARLGETFESEGRSRAVAAYQARSFPPEAELARVGRTLHRVQERPQPHPVAIVGCGTRACPTPASPGSTQRSPAGALAIELSPGETWGDPLTLHYDFWSARVTHHYSPDCPSAEAEAPGSAR